MNDIFPKYRGKLEYTCLGCGKYHGIDELLYTCPDCGSVLILEDRTFFSLKQVSGQEWRNIFDNRAVSKHVKLRGIFRFYELIAPVIDEEDILYLGEGNTPIVNASSNLKNLLGIDFSFKNDGQNPSASFKDRGMACAYSFLKGLAKKNCWDSVLTVCASTGDTSAAAALYGSYVGDPIRTVVLLPAGKVTPQQLSQPLGSGATVLEIPGVFDDCMKVVEYLADNYRVALLNSKNSWRILGQESYAFEVAQWHSWDLDNVCVFVPIGNAGNITAIMSGFLKLYELKIITSLPRIFGVQSHHADPVYQYYSKSKGHRKYSPVKVKASVAQAAMIGNPVSFPRVEHFVEKYCAIAGDDAFNVIQVTEQSIMDSMILANRNGHIACTQGGECLAGMIKSKALGLLSSNSKCVLDSTAHALKFSGFQDMYFNNSFPDSFEVSPDLSLANNPKLLLTEEERLKLTESDFIRKAAKEVVSCLGLQGKK